MAASAPAPVWPSDCRRGCGSWWWAPSTEPFRGYFAGQLLLALILSGLQILVFTLLAIPYGVLFAVAIGFTTLIPYASAVTIVLVSALLALDDPRTGLAVPIASCGKTFLDAWGEQLRAGEAVLRSSGE